MIELFGFSADRFKYADWIDGPYKGYQGLILPDAQVSSLSGGFGNMIFQGVKKPSFLFTDIWKSDYDIVKSFTGRACLDYRSIEISLVLKSSIEHFQASSGWSVYKENNINLTHTMAMDSKTRFEKGVHYQSYDYHLNPIIFDQLMVFMPELVSPFLNDYTAGRDFSLFDNGIHPNAAIVYLVQQLMAWAEQGVSERLYNINLLLLVAQLLLSKAEISQRRGIHTKQKEALQTIKGIKNMLLTEDLRFMGINYYSQNAGMSATNFKKQFKQQTGSTAFQFVQNEKVKQAVVKLLQSDDSITSISQDLGYGDHRALCKAFKKKLGMSPMAFRKENRK